MKKLFTLFFISFFIFGASAQLLLDAPDVSIEIPKSRIVNWTIDERYGTADTIPVDTIITSYQDNNPVNNYSIANSWNGNLGSPIQSKIYFDRTIRTLTMFSSAYDAYTILPEDVRYFDTKKPYSQIVFRSATPRYREEDYLKLLLTMNVNKYINVGGLFNYIYGRAQYAHQASSLQNGGVWASYTGRQYE